MKLLIIRHGDPDYELDSLTEKGWREAKLLADKLCKMDIQYFYVSPLGRAKDTASFTLQHFGKEAIVYDWLQEFPPRIERPDRPNMIAWDWLPQDWTAVPEFYDKDKWKTVPVMKAGKVDLIYDDVVENFDKLLADHGYVREGNIYRVERANNDTIAIFCHFGLSCVLLSHLMNISPMLLWHGYAGLATSVSTVVTEERREGIAYFRAIGLGDISHLYAGGEEPSFAARFCECYTNENERHD